MHHTTKSDTAQKELQKNRWLLIADDDAAFIKALTDQLSNQGFKVISALKVSEAIAKLSKQKFECVLLDMRFEHASGEQIIYTMRSDTVFNQNTPIIVMSGFLDPELVKRIGKQVNGFLVKPFNAEALLEKLNTVLASPQNRMNSTNIS